MACAYAYCWLCRPALRSWTGTRKARGRGHTPGSNVYGLDATSEREPRGVGHGRAAAGAAPRGASDAKRKAGRAAAARRAPRPCRGPWVNVSCKVYIRKYCVRGARTVSIIIIELSCGQSAKNGPVPLGVGTPTRAGCMRARVAYNDLPPPIMAKSRSWGSVCILPIALLPYRHRRYRDRYRHRQRCRCRCR